MDILSTTASKLDVAILPTTPCQVTRVRQSDVATLPTKPYQLTGGLGPAPIVSAIANQLDVSNRTNMHETNMHMINMHVINMHLINMHVINMHVINMHVTSRLGTLMLVIITLMAPDNTVSIHLTLLKRHLVRYVPIPSPTQPGRNLSTTPTSAAFHSGKLLDQKTQGRTISVHHARLDMLLTQTVGSR